MSGIYCLPFNPGLNLNLRHCYLGYSSVTDSCRFGLISSVTSHRCCSLRLYSRCLGAAGSASQRPRKPKRWSASGAWRSSAPKSLFSFCPRQTGACARYDAAGWCSFYGEQRTPGGSLWNIQLCLQKKIIWSQCKGRNYDHTFRKCCLCTVKTFVLHAVVGNLDHLNKWGTWFKLHFLWN